MLSSVIAKLAKTNSKTFLIKAEKQVKMELKPLETKAKVFFPRRQAPGAFHLSFFNVNIAKNLRKVLSRATTAIIS